MHGRNKEQSVEEIQATITDVDEGTKFSILN